MIEQKLHNLKKHLVNKKSVAKRELDVVLRLLNLRGW